VTALAGEASPTRTPPWRDVRVLRAVAQIVFLIGVIAVAAYLGNNLLNNMRRIGIQTNLDYLDQPAGFTIPGSSFRRTQSRMDAVMVGLGNTLRVAVAGIILATVVGTIVGIARLSRNWLVRTGARLYVEFVRNVPLLVIVIFTYLAVFLRLPRIEDSAEALGGIVSVRGVWIPWYEGGDRFATWLLLLAVAAAGAWGVRRWRQRVQDRTGDRAFGILYGLGVFAVGATVSAVALGGPIDITIPDRDGRLVSGGIRMAPEFAALLGALVVYTASHIAEIVRGSIQSVDRGQNEAAQALALSGPQRMRLVILPQALRVAIPPLANQYLNLTKNSSLAVAIAYVELTKVTGDLIGNGAPAPQSYGFLMLLYLMISLVIAAITNLVNRRLRLVER